MGRPTVKLCGVTTVADAQAAAAAGADCLGLNFVPQSPRCLSVPRAREIIAATPSLMHVAVLVRPSEADLQALLGLPLFALQLYAAGGLEGSPTLRTLGAPLVLAAGVACEADWADLLALRQRFTAAGHPVWKLLVDAKVAGQHGGTGQTAPWELLARLEPKDEFFLAGGLTPSNVAAAVRQVRPWGVDVASGVESAPGVKEAAKMRQFVAATANSAS